MMSVYRKAINIICHRFNITIDPGLFRERMSCRLNDLIRIRKFLL